MIERPTSSSGSLDPVLRLAYSTMRYVAAALLALAFVVLLEHKLELLRHRDSPDEFLNRRIDPRRLARVNDTDGAIPATCESAATRICEISANHTGGLSGDEPLNLREGSHRRVAGGRHRECAMGDSVRERCGDV